MSSRLAKQDFTLFPNSHSSRFIERHQTISADSKRLDLPRSFRQEYLQPTGTKITQAISPLTINDVVNYIAPNPLAIQPHSENQRQAKIHVQKLDKNLERDRTSKARICITAAQERGIDIKGYQFVYFLWGARYFAFGPLAVFVDQSLPLWIQDPHRFSLFLIPLTSVLGARIVPLVNEPLCH